MIERNQPNACNMCHVEETLDWTLAHLDKWYERDYDREAILTHAEDPNRPATINWLLGDHQPSRMVAGGVLVNARARWALPELVGALDDPALMNRQFLQQGLDDWLDQSVTKSGYEFYLPVGERNQFIDELKRQLKLPDAMASGANL